MYQKKSNSLWFGRFGALLCVLIATQSYVQAKSVLMNGDFEEGSVEGWSPVPYSQVNPLVVETDHSGWGGYALALKRAKNVSANPPGFFQSFSVDQRARFLTVRFDYENTDGSHVLFRIRSEGQYYNAESGTWNSAEIGKRIKFFQRNWGQDASNKANFDNFKACTALLKNSGTNAYSLNIPVLSGDDSYTLEFYNTVADSTMKVDNISLVENL